MLQLQCTSAHIESTYFEEDDLCIKLRWLQLNLPNQPEGLPEIKSVWPRLKLQQSFV